MTNTMLMNSTSVGFGAVMTEQTGDINNLLVTILVAVLSEVIKYFRAKNKGVQPANIGDKINKAKPWLNLLGGILKKKKK